MLQFVIAFRGTQPREIKDIYTDINVTMVSLHDHENDSLRHFEHLMSLDYLNYCSHLIPKYDTNLHDLISTEPIRIW